MRLPTALKSLAYRDFRLLWAGQFVSMLGTQIQTVALSWLVYDLSGSAAQLGGIGLVRAMPIIILSIFGGALADQVNRRRLLIVSQSILAAISAILAAIITVGWATVPVLYVFAFITAAASSFDSPARQAMIPALVPRERLTNALTLNVVSSETASVLGPAVGGLILGVFGASAAFWLDASSFFAVVAALLLMRTRMTPSPSVRRGWGAVVDGLTFVRERAILWQLMLIDFLGTLFVSTMGLLPVFAQDVLKVGPEGLGLLYAAPSAGAVAGSVLFAFIRPPRRPGRTVAVAIAAYGSALVVFGLSQSFAFALAMLAVAGGLDAISMAMRHTVRQLATPDDLRGRVGALASVFSSGGPRLGEFQAGLTASVLGARGAMVAGGVACVLMVIASRWWAPGLWEYRGEEVPVPVPSGEAKAEPAASGAGPTPARIVRHD